MLVCRELGCVVNDSKFLGRFDNRTYTVSLLPQVEGEPAKMLQEYFPALRVPRMTNNRKIRGGQQ